MSWNWKAKKQGPWQMGSVWQTWSEKLIQNECSLCVHTNKSSFCLPWYDGKHLQREFYLFCCGVAGFQCILSCALNRCISQEASCRDELTGLSQHHRENEPSLAYSPNHSEQSHSTSRVKWTLAPLSPVLSSILRCLSHRRIRNHSCVNRECVSAVRRPFHLARKQS